MTLPIVHCLLAKRADPGLRGADAAHEPGRVRPVPRARAHARRALHPDRDDRRRGARGGRVGRPDRGRDRERRGRGALRPARDRAGRRRPRRVHALRRDRAVHARRPRAALAHGALVRHRPPAGLALPRARAVPPPRPEPGAARVAADPAVDVPLPLRHGARRPSARPRAAEPRSSRCASGRARCGSSAATRRRETTDGATTLFEKIWDAHVVDEQPGRARAALRRPAPRARGDERRRRSSRCGSRAGRCGGPT